ncbi:MAG TPA: hypothetical protein VN661_03370 [Candidatus Acidoferrales bacterium]|nr:hypothetical protein [Candidatus Acidoferrales bacterium]
MSSAAIRERAAASDRWIEADPSEFQAKFNRESFQVVHRLSSHPLFQLDALMDLAKRTTEKRPNHIYYDAGNVRVEQRWNEVPKAEFSAMDALRRIEECGAWIVLRHAQEDPAYRVLLDKGLAEMVALAGKELEPLIKQKDIIIFITSPKRVTTYHIDRECNWILQIHGTKMLYVFDQNDREVLTEEEVELFWARDNNSAKYKPELQSRARGYHLAPSVGVHVPVNAPHWLQNDDNISVTLSVNFQFKDSQRANVYRANYFLRRLGMKPTGPGKPVRDALKNATMAGAVRLRRKLQGDSSPW